MANNGNIMTISSSVIGNEQLWQLASIWRLQLSISWHRRKRIYINDGNLDTFSVVSKGVAVSESHQPVSAWRISAGSQQLAICVSISMASWLFGL